MAEGLLAVFERLHAAHGPQRWWPGDTPFEVMVGAVLTQNTAWTNVERAIAGLKGADALEARRLMELDEAVLAGLIRPAGYFNVKARRLRNFCRWYLEQGGYEALAALDTEPLRAGLLSVNGVGPETADDILLYAFERPVFVIDAYTRRLFGRLGAIDPAAGYEALRGLFERGLAREVRVRGGHATLAALFNEYHALIVMQAKAVCRPRPLCVECALAGVCPVSDGDRTRRQTTVTRAPRRARG